MNTKGTIRSKRRSTYWGRSHMNRNRGEEGRVENQQRKEIKWEPPMKKEGGRSKAANFS